MRRDSPFESRLTQRAADGHKMRHHVTRPLFCALLAGLLGLVAGCDWTGGGLNFNIVIPLGLGDSTGVLDGVDLGTIFTPADPNTGTDTPPPINT